MRIERHQVGEAAVSAARADFVHRIEGQAHSMSRGGRMATYEWQLLAEEYLDYLGALSVEMPDLDAPEAAAVLKDATEAAAGAVAYAAYHPHVPFQIMLPYANFGMSYDPGDADDANGTVTPGEWIDAFCLAILSDKASWHGEAFRFACRAFGEIAPGTPSAELVKGFTAQVIGVTDDDADHSPTPREKLAAVDAALDRIRRRGEERGPDLLDRPHAVGLRTLRALAAGDREAFDSGLAALLLHQSVLPGPGARPHTLLPLLPLALAALAYRSLGWTPAVDTDYLPHALVTGFETPARGSAASAATAVRTRSPPWPPGPWSSTGRHRPSPGTRTSGHASRRTPEKP
ncbi:Imm49 family immunity protein [Streptomyces sp. MS1.HAVA.3]|uniref:Imm49 family immunity protein n=1 Tax=Streptomyces caledonius TaxID=3134107 RepID=A0ABU8U0S2_9ACTN